MTKPLNVEDTMLLHCGGLAMVGNSINCPYCKKKIDLTDAFVQPIEEKIRKNLEKDIRKELAEEASVDLNDMREQLKEKDAKLKEARDQEASLRKQWRELEDRSKNLDLEMNRKLDKERQKINEEATRRINAEHQLKDKEKEKMIGDLTHQIEDLKMKAQLGSQQLQGEILEIEIERLLKDTFPQDEIEPVQKGTAGADVIHRVLLKSGLCCGSIIWESKRTKNWNNVWISKLKDDQRDAKAEIAIIVTTALPDGITNIGFINGVVISDFQSFVPVAILLRTQLIEVARATQVGVGRNEKMEMLYNYLIGTEFKQKVEGVVEAFATMKKELDQEKRAIQNLWAKREKQLQRGMTSMIGMYGGIHGIAGASMPEIKLLEIKELPSGDENKDQNDG
jgi:hypothetical protein